MALEAGAGHEDAGLDQLLGEPVHRRERLGRGWRALLLSSVAFPNNITRIVVSLFEASMAPQIPSRSDETALTRRLVKSTPERLSPSRVLLVAADRSLRDHLRALVWDDDRFMVVDAGGDAVRQVIQLHPSVLVLDVSGRAGTVGADPAPTVEPDTLLTRREAQVVSAVVTAYSNRDIAAQLAITETTVKHHLSNIFDKVGVSSRLELAIFAQHHGLGQTEGTVRRRRTRRSTRDRRATLNAASLPRAI